MSKTEQMAALVSEMQADDLIGLFVRHVGLKPEAGWGDAIRRHAIKAYGPLWANALQGCQAVDASERKAGGFLLALILSEYTSRIRVFCDTLETPAESPEIILSRMPSHISVVIENARKILFANQPERQSPDGIGGAG